MKRITPDEFKREFLKVVEAEIYKSEIVSRWNAKDDYTAFIFKNVFPKIAEGLGINVYIDNYYYLDSVFYAERDTEHFAATSNYAKCISIAMEHENDPTYTAVEMNKLQLFNTHLKVLITYAHPSDMCIYLDRYDKIIRNADLFGDFATHRRQLVVFGSLSEQIVNWRFFAFESAGFQEI